MADITVKTNNQPRELLGWHDLTEAERGDFDWINPDESGNDFFRYRGVAYSLDQFMRLPDNSGIPGQWSGYHGDSYFSGVVIRIVEDGEAVICGTYLQ